ncbi:MAG: LexA repressor [Clostridium sp.]|nr:LexA repressor [Clostridium sp.]
MPVRMTEKDRQMLEYIKTHITVHGYAPSQREIGEAMGMKSTCTVHAHIKKLLILGELETDHPESPRALRVKGQKVILQEITEDGG